MRYYLRGRAGLLCLALILLLASQLWISISIRWVVGEDEVHNQSSFKDVVNNDDGLPRNDVNVTILTTGNSSLPVTAAATSYFSTLSSTSLPLCSREQVRHGKWIPKTYPQLPYLPKQIPKKQCYTLDTQPRPWHTYEWQPDAARRGDCVFTEWSANLFCQEIAALFPFSNSTNTNTTHTTTTTIAVMGDSLSMEHFSALIHSLGVTDFEEESTFLPNGPQTFVYQVCPPSQSVKIVFYRTNFLRDRQVVPILKEYQPNLLILNRGAWYTKDEPYLNRIRGVLDALVEHAAQEYNHKYPPLHVLWRTTVPGHVTCGRFHHPATNVTEMEALVANTSLYSPKELTFQWQQFQHQNQLAEQAFVDVLGTTTNTTRTFNNIIWDILDAYDVNILRPDEHLVKHNDCLHSCQPGSKTLVYNTLLLHILRRWRQQVVVERNT